MQSYTFFANFDRNPGPPTTVGWAIVDGPRADFSQLAIGGISFVGDIALEFSVHSSEIEGKFLHGRPDVIFGNDKALHSQRTTYRLGIARNFSSAGWNTIYVLPGYCCKYRTEDCTNESGRKVCDDDNCLCRFGVVATDQHRERRKEG